MRYTLNAAYPLYKKWIWYVNGNANAYLLRRKDLFPEEAEGGVVVAVVVAPSTGPGLAALGLGRSW